MIFPLINLERLREKLVEVEWWDWEYNPNSFFTATRQFLFLLGSGN